MLQLRIVAGKQYTLELLVHLIWPLAVLNGTLKWRTFIK